MKRYPVIALSLCFMAVISCNPQVKKMPEKEIQAKADSIVKERITNIDEQAAEDLEKRITIEVKAKADSIIAVRTNGVPRDTIIPQQDVAETPEALFRARKKKRQHDTLHR